jgi:hypothetical protein
MRTEPTLARYPVGPPSLPYKGSPRRTITVVSVIIVICVAGAAWWSWHRISLELTAVFAQGFRKAGLPEE